MTISPIQYAYKNIQNDCCDNREQDRSSQGNNATEVTPLKLEITREVYKWYANPHHQVYDTTCDQ
jgi:hypothetical protein